MCVSVQTTMMSIDEVFSSVASATSRDTLLSGVSRVAAKLGYDHVAVAFMQRAATGVVAKSMTTYPDAWVEECTRLPSQHIAMDPILKHLTTQVHPLVWSHATYDSTNISGVYEAFSSYGLGSGMTVSVRGPTGDMACIGFTCAARNTPPGSSLISELGTLQLTASATYNALTRIFANDSTKVRLPNARLTQRELELLRWSRCGKTAWESSTILGISQSTAHFHLKNAIGKLGVASKQQAVLRALELHLID
jgi:DNA-binding CsgD family transcriptional regulator